MMSSVPETRQPNPQVAAEKPVNRACEACRLLKTRCLPDEAESTAKCQRCNKSGRMCVYAAPQKRRQRIRTDTRVAELERQIRDMRAMLTGGRNGAGEKAAEDKDPSAIPSKDKNQSVKGDRLSIIGDGSPSGAIEAEGQTTRRKSLPPTPENSSYADPTLVEMTGDEFGLLARETADWLFNSFKTDLVHHFPGVIISPGTTSKEMRKSKPILFQAVVTAAAYQLDSDILVALFQEMTKVYAYRIFLNGEKSLEIVQAMNTSVIWYCPPDDGCEPGNLQFYQYIHMAATMAIDLGIGTNLDSSEKCLEECRTLLACYLNCSGVALRMRRPNMLAWTDHMDKCLELIENSPLAAPLDKCLVGWVKLQRITSDWSSVIRSASSNVQVTLNGYQRQRDKWKEENPLAFLNVSLSLSYHQDNIFVHECVLEGGPTKLLDLKPMSYVPKTSWECGSIPTPQNPLSPTSVSAVMVCVDSSHALLDIFLSLDSQILQGAPIIFYVRMVYAIVVLVKLCLAASAPSSELGKILDPQILKVDHYMTTILERLTKLAGVKRHRVVQKWRAITSLVNQWYQSTMTGYAQAPNSKCHQSTPSATDGSSSTIPDTEDHLNGVDQHSWLQANAYPKGPNSNGPNTGPTYPDRVSAAPTETRPSSNIDPKSAAYNSTSWLVPDPPLTFTGAEYVPMDMIPGEFPFLNDPSMLLPKDDEMIAFEPSNDDWNFDFM